MKNRKKTTLDYFQHDHWFVRLLVLLIDRFARVGAIANVLVWLRDYFTF